MKYTYINNWEEFVYLVEQPNLQCILIVKSFQIHLDE